MTIVIVVSFTVQDGASPLYVASHEGHTDVVDILVKAGADVNQANTVVCLLTLGAHAQEGYGTCPVCLSVCLSVTT